MDRFGNLRLGAEAGMLEGRAAAGDKVVVEIGETIWESMVASTYGDVGRGELLLYADSSGWLGLALREGDLAARADVRPLELVTIFTRRKVGVRPLLHFLPSQNVAGLEVEKGSDPNFPNAGWRCCGRKSARPRA